MGLRADVQGRGERRPSPIHLLRGSRRTMRRARLASCRSEPVPPRRVLLGFRVPAESPEPPPSSMQYRRLERRDVSSYEDARAARGRRPQDTRDVPLAAGADRRVWPGLSLRCQRLHTRSRAQRVPDRPVPSTHAPNRRDRRHGERGRRNRTAPCRVWPLPQRLAW